MSSKLRNAKVVPNLYDTLVIQQLINRINGHFKKYPPSSTKFVLNNSTLNEICKVVLNSSEVIYFFQKIYDILIDKGYIVIFNCTCKNKTLYDLWAHRFLAEYYEMPCINHDITVMELWCMLSSSKISQSNNGIIIKDGEIDGVFIEPYTSPDKGKNEDNFLPDIDGADYWQVGSSNSK